jgi:hypothetical protein
MMAALAGVTSALSTSALVVMSLLAGATPSIAQDRVLGLLSLPEVFGQGPCHPFEPAAIALHPTPGAALALGSIQVDRHWSFAPHGGCEGLNVSVHGEGTREELPTLEYANESPAAIVLAEQDGWFKIRLSTGAGWLRASPRDQFMPLAELFSVYPTLTSLTDAFSGPLLDAPEGTAATSKHPLGPGLPVRVLAIRAVGDRPWLQVAVMSHSICDADRGGPPDVESIGWVPAHAASGEPMVWFSSRGC